MHAQSEGINRASTCSPKYTHGQKRMHSSTGKGTWFPSRHSLSAEGASQKLIRDEAGVTHLAALDDTVVAQARVALVFPRALILVDASVVLARLGRGK